MTPTLAHEFDALARWRKEQVDATSGFAKWLHDEGLLDAASDAQLAQARERLESDRLMVAFVAEFSRGKSELINALLFGDAGQRLLPATPGRTTMCPIEIGWDARMAPCLSLLPLQTRLEPLSLSDLRAQPTRWKTVSLETSDPSQIAQALQEVTRTQVVSLADARALGFWHDEHPDDNPPLVGQGLVEVPAWRHAALNLPHPLLKRGLVVLDTPGLNAVGAEPELTLSLLPSAHAAVFVLGADTGVTRSDLSLWRDHLGTQAVPRFVVLNKVDVLADPLLSAEAVHLQVEMQRRRTAEALGLSLDAVFAVSARQALNARIEGRESALASSGLPKLEAALVHELLPRRQQVLALGMVQALASAQQSAARQLTDRIRRISEESQELRAVQGRSVPRIKRAMAQLAEESREFEQCTSRLAALRTVHGRLSRQTLELLGSDKLHDLLTRMRREVARSVLHLGARKAFTDLCHALRGQFELAESCVLENETMLLASARDLNAQFGFSLVIEARPSLKPAREELDLIERNYRQFLGLSNALRFNDSRFMEQFLRMLASKLKHCLELARAPIEAWHKAVSEPVDVQLRERRHHFVQRRSALERAATASSELEQQLSLLDAQSLKARMLQQALQERGAALCARAQLDSHTAAEPDAARSSLDQINAPTLTLVSNQSR